MSDPALRRIEGWHTAPADLAIFRRVWLPALEPQRVLLLVHGFGEHSGRYDELAAWFAARGCAVYAYDLRGHGRSGGRRTHVASFDEYLDDLTAIHELVREEHPGLPLTLVGHSMGGLIGLAYLALRKPSLRGAIISAPALAPDRAVPAWRLWLARALRRLAPQLAMASGLDLSGLSRDEEVFRRYLADPLVVRTMTASLGAELIAMAPRVRASAGAIDVPVLMMHGAADPICIASASEEFAAQLRAPGSALRIYPNLRHEIFNEPERERVFGDAWKWLESEAGT
ncbi:MAG: lysophospholipase [Deltaproteobacteria bacterium]|nr:lysophospholipase [Deltaproteobacteria bacterium]